MEHILWGPRLEEKFYLRDTELVAQEMLGKWLVYDSSGGLTAGIIVETEAYLGKKDPSCHSAKGCTERNKVMFGPAGVFYIYFIYGVHYCLNVTTASLDRPEAVLIRALEPKVGIELMRERRHKEKVTELCSGPGKLVQAMGISKTLNGTSSFEGPLGIYDSLESLNFEITVTARVGIKEAANWPLRYYIKGSQYVSKK
ncbi:DNA-3-methyladenine glycosylase [Bacillota bacterium LX-D]|nr:DNA-3-methyladenine glycosylase [Bacillota bacterium LX-D]